MGKLEDIVLKKGDIVYLADGHNVVVDTDCFDTKTLPRLVTHIEYKPSYGSVVKVERPVKYETIYEAPKQILDQREKEYLEAVIRPFKDDVLNIAKVGNLRFSFIQILYEDFEDDSTLNLPHFQSGSMYKGMEFDKNYTLDELGLFKGENK